MSKVLVDRELLELLRNFTVQNDSGVAGAIRGNIDRLLAQPAEAEGVEVRNIVVDALVGMIAGATNTTPPKDQPLPGFIQAPVDRAVERISAALSAVTAERDALKHSLDVKEEFYQDALHSHIVLAQQRDQLRAEVEGLRSLLSKSLPFVEAHAGASHMLEGFRPIRNKWDELVDGIRAAMAAKEV